MALAEQQGSQAHVLVVEDEPIVRGLVLRILMKRGHEAIAVDSAEAACQLLEAGAANVKLVLTDFVMPGMNGLELRAWVQERFPRIPVRIMSGHGDLIPLTPGYAGGREPILAKPFTGAALIEFVNAALAEPDHR